MYLFSSCSLGESPSFVRLWVPFSKPEGSPFPQAIIIMGGLLPLPPGTTTSKDASCPLCTQTWPCILPQLVKTNRGLGSHLLPIGSPHWSLGEEEQGEKPLGRGQKGVPVRQSWQESGQESGWPPEHSPSLLETLEDEQRAVVWGTSGTEESSCFVDPSVSLLRVPVKHDSEPMDRAHPSTLRFCFKSPLISQNCCSNVYLSM